MSRQIEVVVDPQGQTRIETKGFAGDRCRDASRLLERSLGITTNEQITAEFHSQRVDHIQQIEE